MTQTSRSSGGPESVIAIVHGDITQRPVEAIVNAANSTLLGGGGVYGAIHRAAGPGLLAECKTLGGCETGQAKATKAYRTLQAKYIIHTVGPIFGRHSGREAELLASYYRESLRPAIHRPCKSIAFPSISTEAYGYPIEEVSHVALTAIVDFVRQNGGSLDLVEIATFSQRDYKTYLRAYKEVIGMPAGDGSGPLFTEGL
jgi:O-acetyl-ADP-ribose deacetylase (regulator of RNase III)